MIKRLLLIDDDRDQRRLLTMLASKAPDFSVTACDQFEAQALDWSAYDLVIVDAMMPIVSGPELIRQQVDILGANMPQVVLFSAMTMPQLQQMAEGLDGVELMTKSGTLSEIGTRLQKAARE